ncbi:MAG: hypothetical protein HAW60_00140 [Bdellovibrionales bacterium]|nr:hypothetical protein [Bdellovibrionales bacterium]
MKLITDLGLNYTFFIQGALFLASYFFLSSLFKAYYKAYIKRCNLVEGQEKQNQDMQIKTEEIKEKYSFKLKDLNKQVHSIFFKDKKQTEEKIQSLILTAQSSAEKLISDSQEKITKELTKQKEQISISSKEISQIITERIL